MVAGACLTGKADVMSCVAEPLPVPPLEEWGPAEIEELLASRHLFTPEENRRLDRLLRKPVPREAHPKYCFLTFLRECAWTVDEARAGQVRQWPFDARMEAPDPLGRSWDAYWSVWDEALHTSPLLFVDKVRRVMASNVVLAWDLWLCAGGQDPRWPELMLSDRNRAIIIQSKKEEGDTGSQAFISKLERMVYHFEERGGRKKWPTFPKVKFSVKKASFSNGSRCEAVAQGGDQVRGPGSTHIHIEEAAAMEQIEDSITTATPALAGGGHMTVVTTPDAGASFLKKLREGKLGAAGR